MELRYKNGTPLLKTYVGRNECWAAKRFFLDRTLSRNRVADLGFSVDFGFSVGEKVLPQSGVMADL
jgi:hypothetical protein